MSGDTLASQGHSLPSGSHGDRSGGASVLGRAVEPDAPQLQGLEEEELGQQKANEGGSPLSSTFLKEDEDLRPFQKPLTCRSPLLSVPLK